MRNMKESEVKYLAGLLDADGCLSFKFSKSSSGKTFCYLVLALTAVSHIDKKKYILNLSQYGGSSLEYINDRGNLSYKWHVQDRSTLNKLLPRLIKYMVIKAKHWDRMYAAFTELKGKDVTDQVIMLKAFAIESRKDTGPLKAKKHPTWAWIAGYLDGDGCYTFRQSSKGNTLNIGAIAHINDTQGLKLLQKAFGGTIYPKQKDNTRLWRRNLGKRDRSFAKKFLSKVVQHSKLKAFKIERMLNFHNEPQRLTEKTPKGEVIV